MKALRLPIHASPVTYLLRFRGHAIPPCFVLADASAPGRMEVPLRARILVQPAILFAGALSRGREWDLSGFQATHPVPLPRSKTPAGPTNPCHNGLVDAAPANQKAKAPAERLYRGYRGA